MRFIYQLACFCGLLCAAGTACAQDPVLPSEPAATGSITLPPDSSQQFVIRNILIAGNKKTNPNIILRELSFQIDESYPLDILTRKFQKARKQLMNTGLFTDVIVSLKNMSGYDVYVSVSVQEKWYIWPQPFLKTVDKNFHEWWSGNRSMDRINYGLRLTHNNFTGRNDKLKVNLMNGYTKQVQVQYYGLYLDNKLKWSINGGFAVGKNREVTYNTRDNKPVPVKNGNEFLRSYNSWFAEVTYRRAIKTRHTFGIGFTYEDFADTIYKLNPYFAAGHNIVKYPELSYRLSYFDVDFIPYPTKGFMGEVLLQKKGFSGGPVNLWQLTAKGSRTWPAGRGNFFNLRAVGVLKLPFNQPYLTRQFIGYDDQYLQGYEYYIVDGVAGGYTKASFSKPILNTHISIGSKRMKRFNDVPFRLYAKTFVNAGYVYSPYPGQNGLTNKFLYSGGIGLDIVTFTDFVIKIEWSFNRLGENGLYLHQRNNF
jgi:outer membrane protein assembly factor BamA